MKKKNIIVTLMLTGMVLLVGNSCSQEEPMLPQAPESELAPISLKLSVAGMEAGTPETKAVVEPDLMEQGLDPLEKAKQQIHSFCVLQFEHRGSEAILISKTFFEGDEVPPILDGTNTIDVLYTSRKFPGPFTFVVIANTPESQISANVNQTTLTGFSSINTSLSGYDQIFTVVGDKEYLRMNGSITIEDEVNQGTTLEVSLIRNVSKITINVTNTTTGVDKVTLQKVQLRDINGKYYYRTPLDENKKAAYEDPYSATETTRFDKAQEDFPASGNDGSVQTFTYYVPANLRGVKEESKYQYTKGKYAPDGATRFCMYGTYGEGENQASINYTYYLGEDLVRDFNLKPNHHYTYNITLSAKGDARYDYRVEDLAKVKFHTDANCYMVHPPKVGSRIYAIPIRRAATFWNKEGENGGVYGASQWDGYTDISITPNTEWTAVVLNSDFTLPGGFLKKSSGKGYDPTQPTQQDPYFEIKVDAGMKGNAQIAVKVGDRIVWSWHIWITDYNPDIEGLTPADHVYIYDVENGKVHRYRGDIWNKEPTESSFGLKHGFIMDRNLGATGTSRIDNFRSMYYQFGRKDPFNIKMKDKHSTISVNATGQGNFTYANILVANNIRYAVCHPTDYITRAGTSSVWTYNNNNEDGITAQGDGWLDSKYYYHNGDQDILEKKKSIYDPCPAGWKVPNNSTYTNVAPWNWYDYNSYHDSANRYIESTGAGGYFYYPEKYGNKNQTGAIYFPALDFINEMGEMPDPKEGTNYSYMRLWTDNQGNDYSQWLFCINSMEVYNHAFINCLGYNVRCVREYGVVNE